MISKTKIPMCKICFSPFIDLSWRSFYSNNLYICDDCLQQMKPVFDEGKNQGIPYLAIYRYNDKIRTLIYTYKGGGDYELKDVFLGYYRRYLSLRYRHFILVPAPSYPLHDEARGFNHVQEIFKSLGLPLIKAVVKLNPVKQANRSGNKRALIIEDLAPGPDIELVKGQKILLVDDVLTSGYTLASMAKIIQAAGAKTIAILVVAHVVDKRR